MFTRTLIIVHLLHLSIAQLAPTILPFQSIEFTQITEMYSPGRIFDFTDARFPRIYVYRTCLTSTLDNKKGNRDNLQINFPYFSIPLKHTL